MDLNLTPEETRFRDELRAWLGTHVPRNWDHRRDESVRGEGGPGSEVASHFAFSPHGNALCTKAAGPAFRGRASTAGAAPA